MNGSTVRTPDASGWKAFYTPDELLVVSCPRCNSGDAPTVASEFGISIGRCAACGLTYTKTPLPDSQGHYQHGKDHVLAKYGPILRREQPHPRAANYDEHLSVLEQATTGRRLLDVGTHAGFFLARAVDRGWETTGVEPSPDTSEVAREYFGLHIVTGTLEDSTFPDESFDVVTMTDVFEHIGNPMAVLAEVRRVLRPDGLVFIKVPNFRYLRVKKLLLGQVPGALKDCFDAREHLVYYTAPTLRDTLEQAGFRVDRIRVPAPIQSGGPLRRILRSSGPALGRILPSGASTPLATDLTVLARK